MMENSVEERLAAELLRGTLACAVDWCQYYCMLYCTWYHNRTRAVCTVHHVAAANMEPTGLGIGEKVVSCEQGCVCLVSFMFPQEAADVVGVFSEGLTNLKSCTSPANLEKEMKKRYPSEMFSQ